MHLLKHILNTLRKASTGTMVSHFPLRHHVASCCNDFRRSTSTGSGPRPSSVTQNNKPGTWKTSCTTALKKTSVADVCETCEAVACGTVLITRLHQIMCAKLAQAYCELSHVKNICLSCFERCSSKRNRQT